MAQGVGVGLAVCGWYLYEIKVINVDDGKGVWFNDNWPAAEHPNAMVAVVVLSFGGQVKLCSANKSQLPVYSAYSNSQRKVTGHHRRHETSLDCHRQTSRAREVGLEVPLLEKC